MKDYYDPEYTTVMVPIKVSYHLATDTVYSFTAPTRDDVEKALRKGLSEENLQNIKDDISLLSNEAKNLDRNITAHSNVVFLINRVGRWLKLWNKSND